MRRAQLLLAVSIVFVGTADRNPVRAYAALAETAAPKIAHTKFVLENGMKVILVEDHRLPLVVINTWFYVGAKDEPPGRSGFAHLFEHLMFMGTERVPVGQYDRTMEKGGGTNNASTDFDRTNYYSSGPSDLLPTLLWLDADRLEDLGRAMTQEKLDAQRAIVRNERRQTTENVPYGKSTLKVIEMLYPEGHPYHFDVIGSHHDLESATLEDVKEFFANFYVPNNASLVICGDFDSAAVKPLVESLFGTLPRGANPPRRDLKVAPLAGEERFTTLDLVDAPMVRFGWTAPIAYQAGDAEMTLIARVLGEEKNGRLYRRLVDGEALASEIEVSQQSLLAKSKFTIDVRALPGANLDRIEQIVLEEVERLARDGVPADELERARAPQELMILSAFEMLLMKADKMNEYEFFLGEPDGFGADLARFRRVDTGTCAKFASEVFGAKGRAVVRVLPQEPQRGASARDAKPTDFPVKPFTAPAPSSVTLDNGMRIDAYSVPELPRVELRFEITPPTAIAGGRIDKSGAEGAARLLADLLLEGAADRDGPALAEALAALGARLDVAAERESIHCDLSVPAANLDPALDLLADVVLRPKLAPAAFDRVKTLLIEELKEANASPREVGARVADRMLYGALHPLGQPADGTLASVAGIDLPALLAVRQSLFAPERVRVFVAGRAEPSAIREALARRFGSWPRGRGEFAEVMTPKPPASDRMRVYLVDRPGAVQTMVVFAMPGPKRGDEARVPADLLSIVLGGSFTSRLVQNLREDKGYTYGAQCRVRPDHLVGAITASSALRADVTGKGLAEFLKEFARMTSGDLTDEEVARTRALHRIQSVEDFEGLRSRVRLLSELARFGLGVESVASDLAAAATWDRAKLNAFAKTAFPLEKGVLVLVGDASVVLPQLEGLGLPTPVRVTADGDPAAP